MPLTDVSEWFESWFDSPYYHILYQSRDEAEARYFIDRLLDRLHLPEHSRLLDLACGRGRHSRYLHERNYRVVGVDLSEKNINYCRSFEKEGLEFYVHDMRKHFRLRYFDAVFNLFTSFGYFENDHEHQKALSASAGALTLGGYLVIDFLNASYVRRHLRTAQLLEIEGIEFRINKQIDESGYLLKEISFEDKGRSFFFHEKVRLLSIGDFRRYMAVAGLELLETYGNYDLDPYQEQESPRLILISRKIS